MFWYELRGYFLWLPIENSDLECLQENKIYILWVDTNNNCIAPQLIDSATLLWSLDCEAVQDCIWDALQWFDYNDVLNQWLQENPLSSASNISYDNSVSLLTATNMQDAIDEIIADTNIALYESGTDTGIEYTKPNWTVINLKTGHGEVITPVINTPYTITHNLNTTKIQVVAYDVTTGEQVDIEVKNRATNTVDIVSTTTYDIEVVVQR